MSGGKCPDSHAVKLTEQGKVGGGHVNEWVACEYQLPYLIHIIHVLEGVTCDG